VQIFMHTRQRPSQLTVTRLSEIMSGDETSVRGPWSTRHQPESEHFPDDHQRTSETLEHSRLLSRTLAFLAERRAEARVEHRNSFRYRHASGIVIAGRPDIVVLEAMVVVVIDCKTGCFRPAHRLQVQIYMYTLPICFPELAMQLIHGQIIYPDHDVAIHPSTIDSGFGRQLDHFVELLASKSQPPVCPSVASTNALPGSAEHSF